jgi:uncharacterized protein YkwD
MLPGPLAHRRAESQNSLKRRGRNDESPRMVRTAARPRRIALRVLAIAALAAVLSACTPEQIETYDRVNVVRAEHGVSHLDPDLAQMNKAQAWADHLAATGALAHSDPWEGLYDGARAVAENVGFGGDIASVMAAFMASPPHRDNLLNPRWNRVGTGVAVGRNGGVYVVQVFTQY